MLTFPRVIARALLIVAGAIIVDGLTAYAITRHGSSLSEIMGDMMLIEAAVLFLIAGLIDFSSSVGGTQVRRSMLGSKEDYSSCSHKEAVRKALALLLAGVLLFIILIAIAIMSGS